MRLTVAAKAFQMNCIFHPAALVVINRVARLVGTFVDAKTLAAECEHLRHERQIFQAAVFVKGDQYLFTAADLHPIPSFQIPRRIQIVFLHGIASLRDSVASNAQMSFPHLYSCALSSFWLVRAFLK